MEKGVLREEMKFVIEVNLNQLAEGSSYFPNNFVGIKEANIILTHEMKIEAN